MKEVIDTELCTLSEKSLQNFGASKGKLWLKCLTDLYSGEWKGGAVRY